MLWISLNCGFQAGVNPGYFGLGGGTGKHEKEKLCCKRAWKNFLVLSFSSSKKISKYFPVEKKKS